MGTYAWRVVLAPGSVPSATVTTTWFRATFLSAGAAFSVVVSCADTATAAKAASAQASSSSRRASSDVGRWSAIPLKALYCEQERERERKREERRGEVSEGDEGKVRQGALVHVAGHGEDEEKEKE